MAGCPPPGQGPAAETGYRRSEPIIVALDRFRAAHGAYPRALSKLDVPAEVLQPPLGPGQQPWEYRPAVGSYELIFRYAGPGMNYCIYSPAKHWQCSGYY
jgi:hypothetical protein